MTETPSTPRSADAPATKLERSTVPVWLFMVLFLLLYWGMVSFDLHGGWFNPQVYAPFHSIAEVQLYQPAREGPDLTRGKVVFENVCALCHNNDGMGKPSQAPRLAGSEWAQGSPNRLIRIPLLGLTGPITVAGEKVSFPAGMTPMGAALSDDDLAAALSYIRQAWGNKATPITADQVKAIRAALGNRTQPITPDELLGVPE
jgi:mono/diheme cytochrome c family protein